MQSNPKQTKTPQAAHKTHIRVAEVLRLRWEGMCRMVDTVVEKLGRLDVAINNAGLNRNHSAEECSEADWDQTFELNTKGVFLCCQVQCCSCSMRCFSSETFASLNVDEDTCC